MFTDKQKETFQKLKARKLNTKQKADFFYRMSKILKNDLEELEELSNLVDELPTGYLEKIDFQKAAISAMKLTETLLKKIDPTPITEINGEYRATTYFKITQVFPGMPDTMVFAKASSDPTEKEIEFHKMLKAHAEGLKALTETGGRYSPFVCSPDQINEEFISRVLCKGKPCHVEIGPTPELRKSGVVFYPLLGNYWGTGEIHTTKEFIENQQE